jgi:hypothetical protein
VAGGHEHGGRFAPDLQFFAALQQSILLQRTHGHQQAGRAAGEIGGLRVIRHLDVAGVAVLEDAFFQAQRIGMVLVIVVNQRETPITIALIQGDRRRVVDSHLQPQVGAIVLKGASLDAFQQLLAQSAATRPFGNGDRVETRQ